MTRHDVIIIGAGQAGLAMSRALQHHGLDHVVIEAGRVAQSWRARWPSLRLLTPNWMTRLPDHRYGGSEPDGYMSRDEVVRLLQRYASAIDAPLLEQTRIEQVTRAAQGYLVRTDAGELRGRSVVIATGACQEARVPDFAGALPGRVEQVGADRYTSPRQLPEGGVLVVGASATGVQLASEIRRSGRQVTLAVGQHSRVPRRYRGRDILWWLDRIGSLDRVRDVSDEASDQAHEPSLQLIGSDDGRDLDLAALDREGVALVGRLRGVSGDRLSFDADLAWNTALSDARLARLLWRIDDHCVRNGLEAGPPDPPAPFAPPPAATALSLERSGIRSVVWATGFRRRYPWLRVPVLDRGGELRHRAGVTPAAGLYAIGLPFQRTRRSTFIDGVAADARFIARDLAAYFRHSHSIAA
jgi:putative flavoprotein involved in K+ transport